MKCNRCDKEVDITHKEGGELVCKGCFEKITGFRAEKEKETMGTEKIQLKWFLVNCIPIKASPACGPNRGKTKISIQAYSARHANTLACQKLDIHPKNYGFGTREI